MQDMFDFFNQDPENESEAVSSSPLPGNTFVVSIGGSVFAGERLNTAFIGKFANLVNALKREGCRFALVAGGGKIARDYAAAAKALGANNYAIDEIAIRITKVNASLLISAVDDAYPAVLTDIVKSRELIDAGKTPVFGGLVPSFTTDTVAALLSEFLNATFINLTNQDGVFNLDPAKFSQAKLIEEMDHERLLRIMLKADSRGPGENVILDSFTCMILGRSNVPAFILSAEDLENVESAIRGNGFKGTFVRPKEEGHQSISPTE